MITKEKAKQIISLAEGVTPIEWRRINHLIEMGFQSQEDLPFPFIFTRALARSVRKV